MSTRADFNPDTMPVCSVRPPPRWMPGAGASVHFELGANCATSISEGCDDFGCRGVGGFRRAAGRQRDGGQRGANGSDRSTVRFGESGPRREALGGSRSSADRQHHRRSHGRLRRSQHVHVPLGVGAVREDSGGMGLPEGRQDGQERKAHREGGQLLRGSHVPRRRAGGHVQEEGLRRCRHPVHEGNRAVEAHHV